MKNIRPDGRRRDTVEDKSDALRTTQSLINDVRKEWVIGG